MAYAKLVNRYIGENLRRLRIARGLKVQEVARRAGLPASSYSCLEGGWYNINLDNLFRILQALGAEIQDVWPEGQITNREIVDRRAVETILKQSRAKRTPELSVGDVLSAVCQTYKVELSEISSRSRKRHLSEARTIAAVIVKDIPQISLTDLSRALNVHISSLSHCTKRLKEKTERDPSILKRLEVVRRCLRQQRLNEVQSVRVGDFRIQPGDILAARQMSPN